MSDNILVHRTLEASPEIAIDPQGSASSAGFVQQTPPKPHLDVMSPNPSAGASPSDTSTPIRFDSTPPRDREFENISPPSSSAPGITPAHIRAPDWEPNITPPLMSQQERLEEASRVGAIRRREAAVKKDEERRAKFEKARAAAAQKNEKLRKAHVSATWTAEEEQFAKLLIKLNGAENYVRTEILNRLDHRPSTGCKVDLTEMKSSGKTMTEVFDHCQPHSAIDEKKPAFPTILITQLKVLDIMRSALMTEVHNLKRARVAFLEGMGKRKFADIIANQRPAKKAKSQDTRHDNRVDFDHTDSETDFESEVETVTTAAGLSEQGTRYDAQLVDLDHDHSDAEPEIEGENEDIANADRGSN